MLPNQGMTCHWKFEILLLFYVPKDNLKPVSFRSHSLPSFGLAHMDGLLYHGTNHVY